MACFILFTAVGMVNAQLKDLMLKKVGDKVSKNKTEKSSEGTSNTNSSTTTTAPDTSSTKAANQNNTYNPYMNSGGKKEILPQYDFQQNTLMDMKSYDKKGNLETKKSSQMRMHYSNQPYNAVETFDENKKPVGFSIFESKKSQMVMLMDQDGNKMAVVTKIDTAKANERVVNQNQKSGTTISKSGRTKKVLGYNCEEWISTDDKGNKTEMWISSEVPLTMNGSYSMFGGGQNKQMQSNYSGTYPTGYMMEMINYKENGEKFTMTTIEINLNAPKSVSTSGYAVY